MATFLRTMVRITDPEKSRAFYEAHGVRYTRDLDIVPRRRARGDQLLLLDGTLAQLKGQGIELEREPYRVREGGSQLCFVRDPDS